jgi:hypothetical protein
MVAALDTPHRALSDIVSRVLIRFLPIGLRGVVPVLEDAQMGEVLGKISQGAMA